ncbi:MAG: VWA domain-containing protein [Ardenticatenaceae bacterium]|nr:VWA domain-containing protein [Ardenticatenaceae bacterium]MCB8989379.1 VWA domain-containing protein [Ardenticatenaceae bacterium]MCB9004534.1 VWA domain-containing protein [Ardenticatenaceae bacterium]
MSRTRVIFAAIILVTVCAISGIALVQFFNGRGEGGVLGEENGQPTAVPEGTVLVTLASSNTKQNWLDQVVANFNAAGKTTASGAAIVVEVSHVTSGGSLTAILDGTSQPVAWSPGDSSWVDQANEAWQQRVNKPIASETCQPTIYAPLGFAMWRPMAEQLGWPDTPIGWDTIVELASDPEGWASYGRPEWGQFRFGHSHPAYANSGLLSMTGFVYGIAGKTENLTAADVYSDAVQSAMRELEQNTSKYGRQSPAILDAMAREGTSYLHAAAVPEADVLRFNIERGDELTFPLVFIFPAGGTIWADHPYCILDNADWVSDEEAEAAAIFRDYLLAKEQQALAIDNYLRPLDTSIALHTPISLENGTDPRVTPATVPPLPSPNADISAAVIDVFTINKRKATILLVIDVSGSMEGEKIRTARTATVEFLSRLNPDDEVGVMIFNDVVTAIESPARVGDVVEGLTGRVNGLLANGNTALYEGVCQAVDMLNKSQQTDTAAGESRLYGIVLLSDGEDTVGRVTENQMFATCLPANAEADGIKIFPIAFGADADEAVLTRIADVTGGRMFTADPTSISNIYISISAEQ